jgi:hypothetical protein
MNGKSGKERMKLDAASAYAFALRLAQDREFRDRVVSALEHGSAAGRRARQGLGLTGAVVRLASDETLLRELGSLRGDLEQAYERVEARRRTSHKLRNLLLLAALASLAGSPQVRARASAALATVWEALRRSPMLGNLGASSPSTDSRTRPRSLEDLTKEELYERAQQADIPGRSEMSKDQLVEALRAKS